MRRGVRRGVYILPSLLTMGNLFFGLYAIIAIYKNDYSRAALAIIIALVLDFLDGAVARFAKATSDFGVELDSLADLVSFGVAPGMLAYVFAMQPFGRIGWLAAFLFAACGALRLARFNVHTKKLDRRYFVGLPIPAAAGVIASSVLILGESPSLVVLEYEILSPEVTSALMVILVTVIALLMVSKIRYRSLKEIDISRRHPFTILISLLLAMLIVASEPSLLLFAFFFLYTLSGLLRYLPFGRRRALADLGEGLELTPGEPRSP
ncbi:MAG: CDP-diacylglycerol--serine O-phosphatidyltransferase [Candidatus Methylomirabilales bacterium]